MKILTTLGTRPEIIKLSPIIPLLDKRCNHILVHTGQHYSYKMDKIFFEELELREADYALEVGSGSQAIQTGKMLASLEEVLIKEKPNWVLIQGDTNTTLAGALTAAKLNLKLAHVEAGCRSFNRNTPEEINRVVADHLSHLLFAADQKAYSNLLKEGIGREQIYLTGSTLTDACLRNQRYAQQSNILQELNLNKKEYIIATIHRAENTDNLDRLKNLIRALNDLSKTIPLIFPIHPRTQIAINKGKIKINKEVKVIEPLGYLDFLKLLREASLVITDSGGIQEEAVVLNTPALVLRNETEWGDFVSVGKNILLGTNYERITAETKALLANTLKLRKLKKIRYPLPKGASEKIASILLDESKILRREVGNK